MFFGRWVIPCGAEKAAKGGRALFPSRGEFTVFLSGGSGNPVLLQKQKELIPAAVSPPPSSCSIAPKWHPGHQTTIHPFPLLSGPAQQLGCGLGAGRPLKTPGAAPCPSSQGPAKHQDHSLTSVHRVCSGQEQQQQGQSCPHVGAGSSPPAGKRHRESHPGVFMEAVSAAGRIINPRGQASLACCLGASTSEIQLV